VIDIGGTNVKMLASGKDTPRKFPSGPKLTPAQLIEGVLNATQDWDYDAVSIGFPGPILGGQPIMEPNNLGTGWMCFDFESAFRVPVRVINDAAMQAMGSYEGGKMLFLGFGTGVGATIILDGNIDALEIGRFRYKKRTLEEYLGKRGLERLGRKKWQQCVEDVVATMIAALKPDDVVLGGGNVKKLNPLPPGTRAGDNANAFLGGFRIWQGTPDKPKVVGADDKHEPSAMRACGPTNQPPSTSDRS
jgi:polyphosphate glucokinase